MKKSKHNSYTKIHLWITVFCLLFIVLLCSTASAEYDGVRYKLNQMLAQFPAGKYWNHYVTSPGDTVDAKGWFSWDYMDCLTDHSCTVHGASGTTGYYDCNCFDGAIQCYGFANRILYGVFGQLCISELTRRTDIQNIRPGDHIRFISWGDTGHSAIVWDRNGDTLTLYECNYSTTNLCIISQGRTVSLSNSGIVGFYQATNWDSVNQSHSTDSWLDINGFLDGAESGNISGYGTCDVYIGGVLKANDVSDFNSNNGTWSVGTSYEIKDIKAASGHTYLGVHIGSQTGTIGSGGTSVYLKFATTYTVKFNANGGSNPPSNQTKVHGSALTLASGKPNRDGYEFLSWNTKADGTGTTYASGATYSANAGVTLYAQWKSITYIITFNANGGTGAPASITVNGGGTTTLPSTKPTRTGYDFLGWSKSSTATSATYQPGASYPGGKATLYAVWKIKRFTVTFDSDGAGSYSPVTVEYGKTISNLPTPVKRAVSFLGWYTAGGQKVTSSTTVKSNLALTARWSEPTKMTLPSGIKKIDAEAFAGVNTNIFVIPSTVTTIGSKAFANNSNLYTVMVYSRNITPASDAFDNCPNLTICGYSDTPIYYYATAKGIPFKEIVSSSGWVKESEVPVGAEIVSEKWKYDKAETETTTSTETSLDGWTQKDFEWVKKETGTNKYADFPSGFSTSHSLYSKYKTKLTNKETATQKTVVGSTTANVGYIYWHWTLDGRYPTDAANAGKAINVFIWDQSGTDSDGYTYTLFHAFETNSILTPTAGTNTSGNDLDLSGEGIYSTCYHPTYNRASYVSHWWYVTGINSQTYTLYDKLFTYQRTVWVTKESTTKVTESSTIRNVERWVKYGF